MVTQVQAETYTRNNIRSSWKATCLLCYHLPVVLAKIPVYGQKGSISITASQTLKQPIPQLHVILNAQYSASSSIGEHKPTPLITTNMNRKARQAKLIVQKDENIDKAELADLINCLEWFRIVAHKNEVLKQETIRKWKQNSKLKVVNMVEKSAKAVQKL